MSFQREIVITGIGVVSPIGIGKDAYWASLCHGKSGVRRLGLYEDEDMLVPFGGDVADFDPKLYIRPRKSLKVMNRDIQLAVTAADLACTDAAVHERPVDPERFGVVFGTDLMTCELHEMVAVYRNCLVDGEFDFRLWGEKAMSDLYPLWLLKYLPNMPACHIGIAHDARGPNNSITLREVSSLMAISEASRVIERGQAEVIVAGGASSRMHPATWLHGDVLGFSRRSDDPAGASRPFDADRDGMVNGEGAAAFMIETSQNARARGVPVLARILGCATAFEPRRNGQPVQGVAIRRAIAGALKESGLGPDEIGHVNANGLSSVHDDRIEARAIHDILGDVPVTAPKSFFGYLGAGTGAVEMVASVLAFRQGVIPPTLNYERPDPQCPVSVVHGRPAPLGHRTALVLNHARQGQAVALVLAAP